MHSDLHHDEELSRREIREDKFLRRAKDGYYGSNTVLFLSEEKSLRKKGFLTIRSGLNKKGSAPSYVSWENPFKFGISNIIIRYCSGEIDTFPTSEIKNKAQELFVIATRANHDKGKCVTRLLLSQI